MTRVKSLPLFSNNTKSIATIAGNTVIKDVVIVQAGVDKVGDLMDEEFINAIVAQGNSAPTGIKSRAGHPNMCKDSLGTYLGDYYNFRAIDDNGQMKAVADLHLADISKKTQLEGKGISYHDYIVDMATNHPDKFGNSIVFMSKDEFVQIDGKEVRKLSLIENGFTASDIVDSPAATDGLFKSGDDLGIRIADFLDDNPEVFKALDKNPNAIDIFLTKYIHNSKSKSMDFLKALKSKFGKAKSLDLTDASGAVLTIETDAAAPAVGDAVTIAGQPAADGEYAMADNTTIVVMDGKISEIKPDPNAAPADPAAAAADAVTSAADMQKSIDTMQKAFDDKLKAIEDTHAKEIAEMKSAITFLGEQIKSGYTPEEAEHLGSQSRSKKDGARFSVDVDKLRDKNS